MSLKQQGSKPRLAAQNDSFPEFIRGLGNNTVTSFSQDLLKEMPNDALIQAGFKPERQHEEIIFLEKSQATLIKERQRLATQERIHQEEKVVNSAREQEVKEQIKILQAEAKKLAEATKNLDEKVETVANQTPVEPGIYHINFFKNLISFVKSLFKQVTHASNWLSLVLARGKKRAFFWNQVDKSGSKFMLSQERYMATQSG